MIRKSLILLLLAFEIAATAQVRFENYFTDKTLRFDFMLAGNHAKSTVYPLEMKQEPHWGGSLVNLTDPFGYGNLKYEVFDLETGQLIYSKGYGSLYQEWQTTAEAKIMERAFYEVATFPFPLEKVKFVLSLRKKDGEFSAIYETVIDPDNYFIRSEPVVDAAFTRIAGEGDPHKSLDIVFIAEGYRADEMEKFRGDVRRMADILFSYQPYDLMKDKINIWAVEAVSPESGTDVPGEGIYRNTVLNSSYYTFDLDRYLTTFDIKGVNDYAAVVPHDNIVVLINSERYGGGGMYNYYSGTTSDHPLTPQVFTHEFGHGLAGLGDEYYSSDVAYEEFYPLKVEPWEPNITTLVNFESKWKDMIDPSVPVPTPAEPAYSGVVGLFEGAGYSAKGIYRSQTDCRMKSNEADGFCKVCQEAIKRVLLFYSE
jgi:hypothetical protein